MKTNTSPPLPTQKVREGPRRFPVCSVEEAIARIERFCAPCEITSDGEGNHTVIILPEAWNELRTMIYFGKKHAVNRYEQQFQGMGHFYVTSKGQLCIIVSHFLYIYSADRKEMHANVISGPDSSFLDLLKSERAIYNSLEIKFNRDEAGREFDPFLRDGASEVVLFGHTHPDLGVFFSEPDRNSSFAALNFPAVTFVCDPIRKRMKAMVGQEGADARVLVFSYVSTKNKQSSEKTENIQAVRPAQVSDQKIARPTISLEIDETIGAAQAEPGTNIQLEAELGRICSMLLAEKRVKGKFRVYRGLWGALHMEFSMKRKFPRGKPLQECARNTGDR